MHAFEASISKPRHINHNSDHAHTYHAHSPAEDLALCQILHQLLELETKHASDNVWTIVRTLAWKQSLLDLWPFCAKGREEQ